MMTGRTWCSSRELACVIAEHVGLVGGVGTVKPSDGVADSVVERAGWVVEWDVPDQRLGAVVGARAAARMLAVRDQRALPFDGAVEEVTHGHD